MQKLFILLEQKYVNNVKVQMILHVYVPNNSDTALSISCEPTSSWVCA